MPQKVYDKKQKERPVDNPDIPTTLLDLKVSMEPLLAQLRSVASICFTQNFIQKLVDLEAEKEEMEKEKNKLEDGED
jgi:hypothetical protein